MVTENQARYAWYTEGAGAQLLEAEKNRLEETLPKLFGFHLVQIGDPNLASLVTSSRISHRVLITEGDGDTWPCSLLRGGLDSLPVKSDSVDVVLLSHTLEQVKHPHQLLREANRVLIPEGHLIITGLNPFSVWGAWYHLSRRIKHVRPGEKLISLNRIRDWLQLLDLQILSAEFFFFRPPIAKSDIMHRLQFLEKFGAKCCPIFGGAYQILAVKRVMSVTPIRPRWQPKRIWAEEVVPKPSTRQGV